LLTLQKTFGSLNEENVLLELKSSAHAFIKLTADTDGGSSGPYSWGIFAHDGNRLSFYKYGTGAGEKMVIDPDGNIGIGTTSPDNILTIVQGSATTQKSKVKS